MCCAASENNWKQWIISLIIALYVISIMVAAILFIWQSEEDQVGIYTKAWTLASIFVVTAVVISLRRILQHAMHYTQPELQQAIIRILWMVPIYGLNSWLALIKPSAAIYLNIFRDGYEAYIIYNFMIFLNNYLTSQYRDVIAVLESKEQQKHIPPLCCFPPWEMGKVLFGCKLGVLQYIPVRIVTTVVAVICKSLHVYHEGTFNLKDSCIYLVIINSGSQGVAMYCLNLFYVMFKKEFKPVNAIGKLLSMKLFILVSFLQGIIIAVLVEFEVIARGPLWDWHSREEVAIGLHDFLICLEVFVVAIAQNYLFPYKPYVRSQEEGSCFKSFLAMRNFSDTTDDVAEQISHMGTSTSHSTLSRCTICGQHKRKNHTEDQDEKIPTDGQDEKQNSPSLPPTSEDGFSCVSSLPRAVTHHTAHTVINMPEEMVDETAGAKKCEYIALTIPDEVVSDSPDDTSEMGEEEAVKEVDE